MDRVDFYEEGYFHIGQKMKVENRKTREPKGVSIVLTQIPRHVLGIKAIKRP